MKKSNLLLSKIMFASMGLAAFSQAQAALLDFNGAGLSGSSAETYYQASDGVTFSGGGLLADGYLSGVSGQPQFSNYAGGQQIATLSKQAGSSYADSFFDIWVSFDNTVSGVSGDYFGNLGYGASVFAYDDTGSQLDMISFTASSATSTSTVGLLGSFDFGTLSGISRLHLLSNGATASSMLDNLSFTPSPVPVPAAVWLFGSGILGLFGVARRNQQAT